MPKYQVTKCVDAWVHYTAVVEAPTPNEAIEKAQRLDEELDWEEGHTSTYDEVEWHNIEPELVSEEEGE